METQKQAYEKVTQLRDNEHCEFNTVEEGGAVCYKCNGMYLLFELPQYGGNERYIKTYFENQLTELIAKAYSWT